MTMKERLGASLAWWSIGIAKVCVGISICIGLIDNTNIITTAKHGSKINTSVYSMFTVSVDRRFEGWEVVFVDEGEDKCIETTSETWRT
jgi:hypothetical protein